MDALQGLPDVVVLWPLEEAQAWKLRPAESPEAERLMPRRHQRPAGQRQSQHQQIEQQVRGPGEQALPCRHAGGQGRWRRRQPQPNPRQDEQQGAQAERDVKGLDAILRRRMVRQDLVHVPAQADLHEDQRRDRPMQDDGERIVSPLPGRGGGRGHPAIEQITPLRYSGSEGSKRRSRVKGISVACTSRRRPTSGAPHTLTSVGSKGLST